MVLLPNIFFVLSRVSLFQSSFALRPKLALGAAAVALAALSLSPGSAQAYVVTVGGLQYDVTTFTGTYNGNTSKFATAANGGVMPWWDNSSLAPDFTTAVGTNLGTPNVSNTWGPYFGWRTIGVVDVFRYQSSTAAVGAGYTSTRTYAQATLYTPVPAPLPLFGAAAAFGFSRKLRKRIKESCNPLALTKPLA